MGQNFHRPAAVGLLVVLLFLAGGAALQESVTVDEVAHIGAGLSYLQRFDLRFNEEHPPLAKALAALPLVIRGTRADYSSPSWTLATDFFPAYGAQWVFGDAVLGRWNPWKPVLMWARFPMLLLTLLMGWVVFWIGNRLGGGWGGLLCLAAYVTTPAILTFGPMVITDLPVTLFSLLALWELGEIWAAPSRRHAWLFGLALAAAMLSKFTGLLVVGVVVVLFFQTRFRPTASQPSGKEEARLWRRERRKCIMRGFLWAALLVYAVYFVFSIRQPDSALNLVGSGSWAWILRRPLMPIWLFIRGFLVMLAMGSRPMFLLGKAHSHGVIYYYPVVFALKSTLGFLLLLALAAAAGVAWRKRAPVIPEAVRPHWRVLLVSFFVVCSVCILSHLNMSIRHFLLPIVLLILILAPLPRMISAFRRPWVWRATTIGFVTASFAAVLSAYPYFMPFVNSLAFGQPVYALVNDSNVSWNEGLPAVEQFAREQGLTRVRLDWASMSDAAAVVPEAEMWNCQKPAPEDAGQWVVVAAVSILENRNCSYLRQYPARSLAGGSFYAFQMPAAIPAAGAPGGPPPLSDYKEMWGMPFDARAWIVNVDRHPDQLPSEMKSVIDKFQHEYREAQAKKSR